MQQIKSQQDESQQLGLGTSHSRKKYLILIIGFLTCVLAIVVFYQSKLIVNKQQHYQYAPYNRLSPEYQSQPPHLSSIINFDSKISLLTSSIKSIQQSFKQFNCVMMEPLFHSFDFNTKTMYFQTFDEMFMPDCNNIFNQKWTIGKENIKNWNANREVTQWAYEHVKSGDHILYYRPQIYNLLELAILSKLTGVNGKIVILDSLNAKVCLISTMSLYQLNNAQFRSFDDDLAIFGKFDVLIANSSVFRVQSKSNISKLIANSKRLIYQQNVTNLKYFESFKVQRLILQTQSCGKAIYINTISKEGFYSITNQYLQAQRRVLRKQIMQKNSLLTELESQYFDFKLQFLSRLVAERQRLKLYSVQRMCLDQRQPRVQAHFVTTIYGHKIYNVTVEQMLKWEESRQAIEWVRHHQINLPIYYELKYSFNLLAIVQIAFLLKQNLLTVVCHEEECIKIELQINQSKLTNIKIIKQSSHKQSMLSGKIITDNEVLIKESLKNNYLKNGLLLGFFTKQRNQSIDSMRKLYVNYQLKEIITPQPKGLCIGFEYLHYFWNHTHPNGFYEITISDYTSYAFWGYPQQIGQRKKFLIEELTRQTVEIKIITIDTFSYYEVKDWPIHPAYHLLTTIHKSDYVRAYMMHTYGGGYHDIKHLHYDLRYYFDKLSKNETLLAIGWPIQGYPCLSVDGLPPCLLIKLQYPKLLGDSTYIFKKNTSLTREWSQLIRANLQNKYEELKNNPPQVAGEAKGAQYTKEDGTTFISKYPFEWQQIAASKLTRVQYKYLSQIDLSMPQVIYHDYGFADRRGQH